jgi:hypothetical protein
MYELEDFSSPTFQAEVRSAAERIDKSQAELEALQSRLGMYRRNREPLQIARQDPEVEIAKTTVQISEAETELSSAKDSMYSLFATQSSRYSDLRQRVWEREYFGLVQTAAAQVALLASSLRSISAQLAGLKLTPVADTVSCATLDAGASEINDLVTENKMPSNLLIDPSSSLAFSFQHAIREMLRTTDLDAALKKLRENLEALATKQPVCGQPSAARPLQPNPTSKVAGQAVSDERNSAVASSPAEKRHWRPALHEPTFLICSCGAAQIPAPIGSTEITRYTCRRCCARIQRERNIESLRKFCEQRVAQRDFAG